jgi:branched-chain amino acid transport system ATP-binding protein
MLLEVKSLVAGWGHVPVLHEVDLAVNAGELVTVIGANGAGKTTLLRVISGLNPVMAGSVSFAGERIAQRSPAKVAESGVAHVLENRRIFPKHSIRENLRLGGYVRRRDRAGIIADLDRVFEQFPVLAQRQAQAAGTLSGGEQQMLAIAMALMSRPKLLMLDEPSLGLAPRVVHSVYEEIRRLKDSGLTILLIEQRASLALAVSDRALLLNLGRVIISGTAAELTQDEHIRRAYLSA